MPSDLTVLVTAERERLVGLAYLFLGNRHDAEDAVQTAILRLSSAELGHVKDLSSYVNRSVVNECASWKRKRIQQDRAEQRLSVPSTPDLVEAMDVARALHRLTPQHRAVVILRYYLDLDDRAIAEVLGCAPATVRSRLSRALRKLRSDLGEGEQ